MPSENIKYTFLSEKPTLHFILLTIVTTGIYSIYWNVRVIETLKDTYGMSKKYTKKAHFRLWAFVIVYYFLFAGIHSLFAEVLMMHLEGSQDLIGILAKLTLLGIILSIVFMFALSYILHLRKILTYLFIIQRINSKINFLWTFLFQSFYIYSVIHNIPSQNTPNMEKELIC